MADRDLADQLLLLAGPSGRRSATKRTDLAPIPKKCLRVSTKDIGEVIASARTKQRQTVHEMNKISWSLYKYLKNNKKWDIKTMFDFSKHTALTMTATLSVSASTAEKYWFSINQFMRWVIARTEANFVDEITTENVCQWLWYEGFRGNAPSTIRTKLAGVRHLFQYLPVSPAHSQLVTDTVKAVSKQCAQRTKYQCSLRTL